MSGGQRWEVKRRDATRSANVTATDLALYIRQGAVGPSHLFRLEGSTQWLELDQALMMLPDLEESPTEPAPNEPAPTEPAPTEPAPTTEYKSPAKQKSPSGPAHVAQRARPAEPKPAPKQAARSKSAGQRPPKPQPNTRQSKTRQSKAREPQRMASAKRQGSSPSGTQSYEGALDVNVGGDLPTLPPERRSRRIAIAGFDDEDLDMTSMIDMTFLLLVFFMVTSTISPYADLQLPEARAGDAERPEGRVVMILDYPEKPGEKSGGSNPAADGNSVLTGSEFIALKDCLLYLEGEESTPIPPDQIGPALEHAFETNGGGEFILQSNRKMPVGVVRKVLQLAKSAGAGETMIGVARPR